MERIETYLIICIYLATLAMWILLQTLLHYIYSGTYIHYSVNIVIELFYCLGLGNVTTIAKSFLGESILNCVLHHKYMIETSKLMLVHTVHCEVACYCNYM